jgi:hypothetical protein
MQRMILSYNPDPRRQPGPGGRLPAPRQYRVRQLEYFGVDGDRIFEAVHE